MTFAVGEFPSADEPTQGDGKAEMIVFDAYDWHDPEHIGDMRANQILAGAT